MLIKWHLSRDLKEVRRELEEPEVRPSQAEGITSAKALSEEQACPRNGWETSERSESSGGPGEEGETRSEGQLLGP